jgi:hypothetical protein
MDLSMPDIMASLCMGIVGLGIFRYGKKASRAPQFVAGIALMGSPYFVTGAVGMLSAGGVIVIGLWVAVRCGL